MKKNNNYHHHEDHHHGAGRGQGRGYGRGLYGNHGEHRDHDEHHHSGRGRHHDHDHDHEHAGRNKGGAFGPSGYCVCVKCGYKTEHQRGVKCTTLKCPECGHVMARKELLDEKRGKR